ncbi:MAG: hypothetical protein Q9159_002500 [Coniocarpon cinnabarinum]
MQNERWDRLEAPLYYITDRPANIRIVENHDSALNQGTEPDINATVFSTVNDARSAFRGFFMQAPEDMMMRSGLGPVNGHYLGTSTLHERDNPLTSYGEIVQDDSSASNGLKYDRTVSPPVLLVPQPSNDPADPLNLPLWRRDIQLAVLSLIAVLATTLSPILAADSLTVSFYFEVTFTKVALLTGWHLLAVGLSGIFFVPSARIWGKRHLYLLGTALVCASCAWAGAVGHSYKSLVWARVVQGIGLAPFEALVNTSVADLFFVHERGKRMAISNLALFGGAFFTPVIAGRITVAMSWKWTFNFVAIFTGVMFPIVLLFSPETAWRRPGYNGGSVGEVRNTSLAPYDGFGKESEKETFAAVNNASPSTSTSTPPPPRRSYFTTLSPFSGRKTDEDFFRLLFRPFPLFAQPGILWACLIQGTLIGWTVFIGIVLAAIMLGPPLFFNSEQVGYMYTGAFVGALIGFAVCGLTADWVPRQLTKWNNGIYEPEFRMFLVIPQFFFGCIGLYAFGWTAADAFTYSWQGPAVCFGLEVAGMVCGAVASALYLADAHPDIAIECFTCLLIFKNIFSFGLTYHGYDWIVKLGVKRIFVIVGSCQVAVCGLTLFMYVFGKVNRSFWARHDMLKILRLR